MKDIFTVESGKEHYKQRIFFENLMWESARKMLVAALESEVEEFMQKHRHELDYDGHRTVGINGYIPDCSDFRMPWGKSGNR